jgi:hypothetical protein
LLKEACSDGATVEVKRAAVLDAVAHRAYFFCPTNQVMTTFQAYFGLSRHPILNVRP